MLSCTLVIRFVPQVSFVYTCGDPEEWEVRRQGSAGRTTGSGSLLIIQDHPPIISGIYIDTTNCDFLILYKYLDIFKRNDGIYYWDYRFTWWCYQYYSNVLADGSWSIKLNHRHRKAWARVTRRTMLRKMNYQCMCRHSRWTLGRNWFILPTSLTRRSWRTHQSLLLMVPNLDAVTS